jgi:hypothetical protein
MVCIVMCYRFWEKQKRHHETFLFSDFHFQNVTEKEYKFIVTFKPKENWVDDIFLGNLLGELLFKLQSESNAFTVEIKKVE